MTLNSLTPDGPDKFGAINIIVICLAITVAFINIITVVLNRIIKIYNMDTIISSYSTYISNMDHLFLTISSELVLPPDLREDADVFIVKTNVTYSSVTQKSPSIDLGYQEDAMNQYNLYIEGKITNFNHAQKYASNDANVAVI